MLVANLPMARGVRVIRHPFEHHRGGAVGQRAIQNIAVTGDPAHVRRAPIYITVVIIEDVLMGHGGIDHIAPRGVQHALGLARGAGGIEDEQGILRAHLHRRAIGGLIRHQVVVPDVPARGEIDVPPGSVDHNAMLDRWALRNGRIRVRFQGNGFAAPHALVRRDDQIAVAILNASGQGVGGKAAEDHGMDGADAGTGQHRHRDLGDHGQIDGHPVALLGAQGFQSVGESAHFAVQFLVGEGLAIGRVIAFPNNRGLITAGVEVAVEAVVGGIQRPVLVPFDGHVAGTVSSVFHLCIGLEPIDPLALFPPKAVRVIDGLLVHGKILFVVGKGPACPGIGNGEQFIVAHHGLHGAIPMGIALSSKIWAYPI